MQKFSSYLNFIAATIIGITVIGVLLISFKNLSKKPDEIKTIKIEYHEVKLDSVNHLSIIEIRKIDSLLHGIQKTSNEIQNRQLNLVKEKENDNFFNRLYTAIIAIILALAGFFGFKSVTEIQERAVKDAKEEANIIAQKQFAKIFNDTYKASVFQECTSAVTELIRNEIGDLDSRVTNLENSTEVESEETKETEEENSEPKRPFDDED
ncbi:MAG: hypothetical protein WD048_13730 [Chitinophagales bacterium]